MIYQVYDFSKIPPTYHEYEIDGKNIDIDSARRIPDRFSSADPVIPPSDGNWYINKGSEWVKYDKDEQEGCFA